MGKLDFAFAGVDIESSGLNPIRDDLVEVAIVFADEQLNIVDKITPSPVHYTQEHVDAHWSQWCIDTHTENGLVEQAKASTLSLAQLDSFIINELEERHHPQGPDRFPMLGASVHFDREFLKYNLPRTFNWFSYRNIDVSTVYELAKVWRPDLVEMIPRPGKEGMRHRAYDDICQTVDYLRNYLKHFFVTEHL